MIDHNAIESMLGCLKSWGGWGTEGKLKSLSGAFLQKCKCRHCIQERWLTRTAPATFINEDHSTGTEQPNVSMDAERGIPTIWR
jgi:hypothetical protein